MAYICRAVQVQRPLHLNTPDRSEAHTVNENSDSVKTFRDKNTDCKPSQ